MTASAALDSAQIAERLNLRKTAPGQKRLDRARLIVAVFEQQPGSVGGGPTQRMQQQQLGVEPVNAAGLRANQRAGETYEVCAKLAVATKIRAACARVYWLRRHFCH